MRKKEKAAIVQKVLDVFFPSPPIPLRHKDPYTLLIAVLLSAQCTDVRVNQVTPLLFRKGGTPKKMIKLSAEEIEEIIRPCGLAPGKSKAIWELSKKLVEEHGGKVPNTFEELEALPGVGHKTASVVMAQAFNIPAFPVDTHIHRCAKRWGLSNGKTVEKTERDLKKVFEEKDWIKLHLQIIHFARKYCPAKKHQRQYCPICSAIS
ncbi:MAG: endonuclease III [Waddliaceae bacterium]